MSLKEKIKKVAQLQKESAELLWEEKTTEAIAKMTEASQLTDEIADEAKEEDVETTKVETTDAEKEAIEKTAKETIKKYADAYISGSDFADVLKQIFEASQMFKDMESITKTLEKLDFEKVMDAVEVIEKIADEESGSTSVDPWKETIEKTEKQKDEEIWDDLGL